MSEPSRLEAIFLAALDRPTPDERAAYLESACRGDAALRRQVERLLAAQPGAADFLERPAAGEATAAYVPPSEPAGTVIAGRYKLLERIGEGGMGTVWVAEQLEPVRRRVALKLIKAGMDSRAVLGRFEAERQALALMDHPHIARVFDGGTTEQGRPYFVMELVKGLPLTRYCDERRMSVEQRLALFTQICSAVQHAHQKGIIHRDLKPGNVLVTEHDGQPVPKVIDFGLAKSLGATNRLTEQTLYTAYGTVVGTPYYMAPEQVGINALDVDTRTDIFALGVMLYELLTGTTPLERQRFQRAAWDEIRRLIREEEPPRPSQRLSHSESLASLAASRSTEPLKLSRLIRGDLDWIVMKALEKDRNRRYDTANALAADVQRFLSAEPVLAVPPSAGYRLRKFVRRHKWPVTAGAVVLVGLLIGVIGLWAGLVRVDAERQRALIAEGQARTERQQAEAERKRAELTAADLQVELDLQAVEDDTRIGLLRLARTLPTIPPEALTLREFVTTAILAAGQLYAPLTPPLTHDGHSIVHHEFSPDGRLIVTLGEDRQARLWESATSRRIAILQQGDERLVNCAFTLDGKTVVTDSEDGVLRFWDAANGQFRAASAPSTSPFSEGRLKVELAERGLSEMLQYSVNILACGTNRVLTKRDPDPPGTWPQEGPVELWDVETGRRVAELNEPGDMHSVRFAAGGQQILGETERTVQKDGKTYYETTHVILWSADDGRELLRTPLPDADKGHYGTVYAPSPRRLIASTSSADKNWQYWHVWETGGWRLLQKLRYSGGYAYDSDVRELPDGRLALNMTGTWYLFRDGAAEPQKSVEDSAEFGQFSGSRYWNEAGQLFDVQTGKELRPPAGRRLHPELAEVVPNGRYLARSRTSDFWLYDIAADKSVTTPDFDDWFFGDEASPWVGLSDRCLGFATAREDRRWLPQIPLSIPKIAPQQLELWAQVAVCGELGPDGGFQPWDEPTWEQHRQELAALPSLSADVPFPGYVAHDGQHWMRQQYDAVSWHATTSDPADLIRPIETLLERARIAGDTAETRYWQTRLETLRKELNLEQKSSQPPEKPNE